MLFLGGLCDIESFEREIDRLFALRLFEDSHGENGKALIKREPAVIDPENVLFVLALALTVLDFTALGKRILIQIKDLHVIDIRPLHTQQMLLRALIATRLQIANAVQITRGFLHKIKERRELLVLLHFDELKLQRNGLLFLLQFLFGHRHDLKLRFSFLAHSDKAVLKLRSESSFS